MMSTFQTFFGRSGNEGNNVKAKVCRLCYVNALPDATLTDDVTSSTSRMWAGHSYEVLPNLWLCYVYSYT
jgi:hypothetical protein